MPLARKKLPSKRQRALEKGFEYVGKLLVELEDLRDTRLRREMWIARAVEAAGFPRNTSFDVVWEAALAAYLKEKAKCP